MKSVLLATFSFLVSGLPISAAMAGEFIQLPEKVFAPGGFDSNDHAEFVLYGHFPDSCYRAGQAAARFQNGRIVATNYAYRDEGTKCLKMSVPWTTPVSVGVLPPGEYPIDLEAANGESVPFERLFIAKARSPSIDDYPYAHVSGVLAKVDRNTGIAVVTLSGTFGVTCMYIEDIKVDQSKRDVVSIRPIVAFDRTKTCGYPFVPIPYRRTFRIDGPLRARATLLHVRSMNGQSVNQVVEF